MIDPGAPSIPTSVINPSQRSSFKTLSKTNPRLAKERTVTRRDMGSVLIHGQ